MNYYAVLDTNVLVSAMLKNDSVPGVVLELALSGNIIPVFNEEILKEYSQVLRRSKFHLTETIVDGLLQTLIKCGINVETEQRMDCLEFTDPDDVVFYQVVMEKRKSMNTYLVTGNLKHFPIKPFVITPRAMLDLILANQNNS